LEVLLHSISYKSISIYSSSEFEMFGRSKEWICMILGFSLLEVFDYWFLLHANNRAAEVFYFSYEWFSSNQCVKLLEYRRPLYWQLNFYL
jgi:hypothetical protein